MSLRPLLGREEIERRLQLVFPREAFDTVLSNPLSAAAVAAMLYVDAVVPDKGDLDGDTVWARPTTCLWLSDAAYRRSDQESREQWRWAAAKGKDKVAELLASWGESFIPWYADNTRETVRDETFPAWRDEGAMRQRSGLPTSSSKPRWALTESFADLFAPELTGDELVGAVDDWRETHMSPGGRLRADTARRRADRQHEVKVTLPDGEVRHLEPGGASLILQGVIEKWAPIRLGDPVVLTISEPGEKVYTADAAILERLGVSIDVANLLPDAIVVDLDDEPPTFWIVEVVHSDGPISEARKDALLRWAEEQRIPPGTCQFLTAFASRGSTPARRRLKDLAQDTFAWYLDEPERELAWYDLD